MRTKQENKVRHSKRPAPAPEPEHCTDAIAVGSHQQREGDCGERGAPRPDDDAGHGQEAVAH